MSDLHGDALNRIIGDMDSMESSRMFPKAGSGEGATITISVMPGHAEPDGDEDDDGDDMYPEGHDIELCKGGCAYHKGGIAMADGGVVEPPMADESGLPPFLRKKKGK